MHLLLQISFQYLTHLSALFDSRYDLFKLEVAMVSKVAMALKDSLFFFSVLFKKNHFSNENQT